MVMSERLRTTLLLPTHSLSSFAPFAANTGWSSADPFTTVSLAPAPRIAKEKVPSPDNAVMHTFSKKVPAPSWTVSPETALSTASWIDEKSQPLEQTVQVAA
jgi:hypothetical protein